MKILFITPFNILPPYWGGGQRTYHLVKYLAKKHKVFLIFPSYKQFKHIDKKIIEKYSKELRKENVSFYSIGNWLKFQVIEHINLLIFFKSLFLVIFKKIDLIICDYPWSGGYVMLLKFFTEKPYILMEHNIEYLIKEQTKSKYSKLMKFIEILLSKHAKYVVTVSNKEKEILEKLGIQKKKIQVIENGFDSERFFVNNKVRKKIRKKLGIGNEQVIFFCGKFDYAPNVEAVYNIYWEILPRVIKKIPDVKFLIVGSGMNGHSFNFTDKHILFTGPVENIQDYLNASDVVICPVTKGGGTRIKVLEGIACGKMVISTSKGVEGLLNKTTKPFIKVANDWKTFSYDIIENVRKSNKKVSKKFVEKYAWKNVYKKIDRIIKHI